MLCDEAAAGTFDLCFIDADKRAYGDYFDRAMQLVRAFWQCARACRSRARARAQVRVGGLIAVDNTLWYGKVADAEVQDKQTLALREFNARVLAGAACAIRSCERRSGLTTLTAAQMCASRTPWCPSATG